MLLARVLGPAPVKECDAWGTQHVLCGSEGLRIFHFSSALWENACATNYAIKEICISEHQAKAPTCRYLNLEKVGRHSHHRCSDKPENPSSAAMGAATPLRQKVATPE